MGLTKAAGGGELGPGGGCWCCFGCITRRFLAYAPGWAFGQRRNVATFWALLPVWGHNVARLDRAGGGAAEWAVSERRLHIAAYDIRAPKRLRLALQVMKRYSSGGQRSVFECFLSEAERVELLGLIDEVIDPEEDSFLLFRLDPRSEIRTLGIAVAPSDAPYYYAG